MHHCFAFFSVTYARAHHGSVLTGSAMGCLTRMHLLKSLWQSRQHYGMEDALGGVVRTTLLLPSSMSTLFPRTTKGKLSGSDGLACADQTAGSQSSMSNRVLHACAQQMSLCRACEPDRGTHEEHRLMSMCMCCCAPEAHG